MLVISYVLLALKALLLIWHMCWFIIFRFKNDTQGMLYNALWTIILLLI